MAGGEVDVARWRRVEDAQRRVLTALDKLDAAMTMPSSDDDATSAAAAAMEARVERVASRQQSTLAALATIEKNMGVD